MFSVISENPASSANSGGIVCLVVDFPTVLVVSECSTVLIDHCCIVIIIIVMMINDK